MRSSVTDTVLALSLAFRIGNITTRATHAATELGALLLQFPPWPAISQATAEQELAPLSASRPRKLGTGPADVRTKVAQLGPNAQHAVRQAVVLARNIVAFGRGGQLKPYRHAYVGSVAGLGHHQGVAQVYRIRLTGFAG